MSAVLDALPWPTVVLRPDLTIVYVTAAYRDTFQSNSESLIGSSLDDLPAPWNCAEVRAAAGTLVTPSGNGTGLHEVAVPGRGPLRVVCAALSPCDLAEGGVLLFIDGRASRGRLEAEVQELNERLEAALARRTEQVREQSAQLHELATELIEAEARERERLADQLHDDLQQMLVAAQLRLHVLDKRPPPEQVAAVGEAVRELLQQAIDATRSLAIELSPPLPDGSGLAAGMRWMAQHFRQQYDLAVGLRMEGVPESVPPPLLGFVLRAVREMLFNVVKHAGVAEATLAARSTPDGPLVVVVEDHGRGCSGLEVEAPVLGYGLSAICRRATALGGSCVIHATQGGGCSVTLSLPLGPMRGPG